MLIGLGGVVNTFYSNRNSERHRQDDQSRIAALKEAVDTANKNQKDNTVVFIDAFGALAQKVTDLKAELKTADLRQKAERLQAELNEVKTVVAQQPEFLLYVNKSKITSNGTLAIPRIDGLYPLQISFANVGSKTATGVLIEVIAPVDASRLKPPWRLSGGAALGNHLAQFGQPFFADYSINVPVHTGVSFNLEPLFLKVSGSSSVDVAIKCTERTVSWWGITVNLQ
jgi:hypothetical protein